MLQHKDARPRWATSLWSYEWFMYVRRRRLSRNVVIKYTYRRDTLSTFETIEFQLCTVMPKNAWTFQAKFRDAIFASVEVTRCVCRTQISRCLQPALSPLEPGERRA